MPFDEHTGISKPVRVVLKETPLIDRIEEMALLKETTDNSIRGEGGLSFFMEKLE